MHALIAMVSSLESTLTSSYSSSHKRKVQQQDTNELRGHVQLHSALIDLEGADVKVHGVVKLAIVRRALAAACDNKDWKGVAILLSHQDAAAATAAAAARRQQQQQQQQQ